MIDEEKEILKLREEIKNHNYFYYVLDSPQINDVQYDVLMQRLKYLEIKNPDMHDKTSPTLIVGGVALNKFKHVKHQIQMNSLQDVFKLDDVHDFFRKMKEKLSKDIYYAVEPKIDGLSVSLEYKNGKLLEAATRGNGFVGENVTENIKMIKSIPLKLKEPIPHLILRGEVYMPDFAFKELIMEQKKNNEELFKNARNAAAGSLRQKNPKITEMRTLDMLIFNVQNVEKFIFKSHIESLNWLASLGFNVIKSYGPYMHIEDILEKLNFIKSNRYDNLFGIDGAVIKLDNLKYRSVLGKTSKYPRWAIAFKYPPEEIKTKVLSIKINVGRTGILTPVAHLVPTIVSGSEVEKAVLHNQNFIMKKKINIGRDVLIRKAGDVIPEVVKVLNGDDTYFKIPCICPSCGEYVFEEGADLICKNINCPAQLFRSILHFTSRDAMNIEGLGQRIIQKLINNDIIHSIADIYSITKEKLLNLENFGNKSADNIINAVENSKKIGLTGLIFGLGIKHIGQTASKDLAEYFGDIEKLFEVTYDNILELNGFGKEMAEAIVNYFSLTQTRKCINELKNAGVLTTLETIKKSGKFGNLNFVITGTFSFMKRYEIENIIQNESGKILNSVSKNVNYLVAGKNPSSKLSKAQQLNVKIIGEDEFKKMLQLGGK